jgi:O-antigen/teichoic acid export membrane protein
MLHKKSSLFWFVLADAAWKLSTLGVITCASRLLPKEQATAVVLAQTACMVLTGLGDLGFKLIGTRIVAAEPATGWDVAKAVTRKRLLAWLCLALPASLGVAAFISDDPRRALYIGLIVLSWSPYFLINDWLLLALKKQQLFGQIRMVSAMVILAVAAGGLYWFAHILWVGLAYFCGYAVFAGLIWLGQRKTAEQPRQAVPTTDLARQLSWQASFVLAISFMLNTLFHSLEILWSGRFLDGETTAVFAAAFRLVLLGYSVSWLLTQFLSPYLVGRGTRRVLLGRYSAQEAGFAAVLTVGLGMSLAFYLLPHYMVWLVYGKKFLSAEYPLKMLSGSMALDAVSAFLGTLLVMRGHDSASWRALATGCIGSALTMFCTMALFGRNLDVLILGKYGAYSLLIGMQAILLRKHSRERPLC